MVVKSTFKQLSSNLKKNIKLLIGTYDGQTISIYVNGALAGTKSHPGNISNPNISFTVGKFFNIFWSGAVDDIRLYSRVLSQSDITKLYTE